MQSTVVITVSITGAAHTPTFTAQPPPAGALGTTGRRGGAAPHSALQHYSQQSATRRRMRSLLAGPLASPITPTLHAGMTGGGGGGSCHPSGIPFSAKFTPNHSIASMGESSPFVRLARLPATSTPLARGTALGGGAAVTPVMQQQHGAAAQLTKRALSALPLSTSAEDEEDLLISSVWLELLWTEKDPSERRATKFFISHDLNMVPYVNWMVGEQLAVMKIALPNTARIPTLICPPGLQPTFIPTAGAEYVEHSRLTAIVASDQTSIGLYSGHSKAAVLVMKMPLASPARFRLLCAADNTIAVATMNGDVLHVRLPPLFRSQFAARMWDTLADSLATIPDKLSKLLIAWITLNKEMEVASLARLIIEHAGVSMEEMAPEIENVDESDSALDDGDDNDEMAGDIPDDEVPAEDEIAQVLARMSNKQRRRATVAGVRRILKKEAARATTHIPSPTKGGDRTAADQASSSMSDEAVGEKRKSEEKTGEDTVGAKQSRSEESMEEDEKWRLVCDVLQSFSGAFPLPPSALKDPLRSAGARLCSTSSATGGTAGGEDAAEGGGADASSGRAGARAELTARTPSPLYPWQRETKEEGADDSMREPTEPMSRFYRAAVLCRRARDDAYSECASAAVKRRKRRVLLTTSAETEERTTMGAVAPVVFQALHLSYEESKMHLAEYEMLRVLVLHLFIFARSRSFGAYANYYARDFPYLREIQVLSRPSVDSDELELLPPLKERDEEGGETEEETKLERAQATSWDRCRRTPGERRGGAYGGLLQLRRTQAAGQGAVTPTTASLFTPPTGAMRGQVLQPPAAAALASFSPAVVPSATEYLCSLLHLAGHTSSMSIYESLLNTIPSPATTDRGQMSSPEELLQQLLRDKVPRGARSGAFDGASSSSVAVDGSFASPSTAPTAAGANMSTPSMLCSPLPPQVRNERKNRGRTWSDDKLGFGEAMKPQVSSGSFSLAPPATPLASGLFAGELGIRGGRAAGVGLGLVRCTGDLVRMLTGSWARRLRVKEEKAQEILAAVNDRVTDDPTRCERVFVALGWSKDTVDNLNPTLKILIAMITNKPRSQKPSLFFGKIEVPSKLNDFPTPADTYHLLRRRWPHDQRTENVVSMMDSFRPIYVPIVAKLSPIMVTPGNYDAAAAEAEQREKQEAFLAAVNHRTLSQSFGRAIMNFRTVLPVPNKTLHVRDICLQGRIHTSNLPIDVPATDNTKVLRDWGDFYQGVAVGLTVVPAEVMETDSEWLTQSHGQDKPSVMNGLLFAFGLNGHIKALNMFYVHEHLTNQDRMTSVSLLLGLSAAYLGTGDLQVHKILVTHLPFLMGPTLLEIHVDGLLQTAAVAGMGLLFARSCRTALINHLINEMGREQDLETEQPSIDRYAYGLTCGFSIGLIGLAKGDEIAINNVPLKQTMRAIADRLIVLMNGGCRSDCVFLPSGGEAQSTLGVNGLMPEQLSTAIGAMAAAAHHQAQSANHPLGGVPPPSSHVKEDPEHVNVHITGHGATIALGLLFMKSGNRNIATSLALPNTIYELEGIRPDLYSVRVLAKALVEWEEIAPSREWMMAQIPPVIKKYEGILIRMEDEGFVPTREWKRYWERIVDRETVAQTYLYCVAGALFAMALKYPSTSHPTISNMLHQWVEVLMPRREMDRHANYWNTNENRGKREGYSRMCRLAGQSCVSDCLNQVVLALAVLHAGSGDLQALRVFRALRMGGGGDPLKWAKETTSMHAQQSTAHTAMGLLFAGAGRCGLRNDDRSIALLIISLYPVSCANVADNKVYLQPLRFLWSLCLEPRVLYSVATSNGLPTAQTVKYEWKLEKAKKRVIGENGVERLVDIENTHHEVKPVSSKVPVVLPPLDMLSNVTVGGDFIDCSQFDMSNAEDRASLEKVLRLQHGRVAHKSIDAQAHMVDTALAACGARTLQPTGAMARRAAAAAAAAAAGSSQGGRLFASPPQQTTQSMQPIRNADDRWTDQTVVVPDREKLNRWMDKLQPSVGDPLYQCAHGPIAVKAINEMHDLTYHWCLDSGSFEAQAQVLSVYKRLLTEDMAESALAYNDATFLCRIIEGKKDMHFNDIRMVQMMDELITRKVEESKPRSLAPRNYRLKTKDCVDPTLFQIIQ
ncbi:mat-2 [Pristionchus pacificus]|uniref:Anaphase-promoting complex subunit 1 n=1 Tax=Pristionchus pacificus TaxID=54126 RepID=A0A2A6B8B5_PRIPA|nr:mat-2 [Pristionchus pacificus]|eukprot:PDM62119.1 mat-2 [Pristionchus pacificus]